MRQHFASEQWLPFTLPTVFAFFANPVHLPPLMPAWQHARVDEVTLVPPPPPPPGTPVFPGVKAGSETLLRITARSIPGFPPRSPWVARIQDFRWNEGFCDVQLEGPFSFWKHCHSVRPATKGGTLGTVVRDEVEYALPLQPISSPARPLAALAMQALFAHRQRKADLLLPQFAQSGETRTA